MAQLFVLLTGILVWLSPLLVVGGLLALAGWRDRRALAAIARQTRLCDALADEVGVIVAPVVTKRSEGGASGSRCRSGVPPSWPASCGCSTGRFGRLGPDRYVIILTPQEPAPPAPTCRRPPEERLRAA